jgi:hypothetical protein
LGRHRDRWDAGYKVFPDWAVAGASVDRGGDHSSASPALYQGQVHDCQLAAGRDSPSARAWPMPQQDERLGVPEQHQGQPPPDEQAMAVQTPERQVAPPLERKAVQRSQWDE